jgi:hypothetical protein
MDFFFKNYFWKEKWRCSNRQLSHTVRKIQSKWMSKASENTLEWEQAEEEHWSHRLSIVITILDSVHLLFEAGRP